jgi:hypothetical protein
MPDLEKAKAEMLKDPAPLLSVQRYIRALEAELGAERDKWEKRARDVGGTYMSNHWDGVDQKGAGT